MTRCKNNQLGIAYAAEKIDNGKKRGMKKSHVHYKIQQLPLGQSISYQLRQAPSSAAVLMTPPFLRISMVYSRSDSPSFGTGYHHFTVCPSTSHLPWLTCTDMSRTVEGIKSAEET